MEGEKDGGGLLAYNYVSGEHITGIEEGRPLFIRRPDSHFTMANFMRTHLYASLSTLRIGMNILMEQEQVHVKKMLGHGGLFKTEGVGQSIMAAALHAPVCVMETAGEGGAWGIALLASYMLHRNDGEGLTEYLAQHVFDKAHSRQMSPDAESMEGFDTFIKRYAEGLSIERAAAHHM